MHRRALRTAVRTLGQARRASRPPPSSRPAAALTPLQSRARLRQSAPVQSIQLAGVSFEGRQEVLGALLPGQPLVLQREPDNPHDSDAVSVSTLDGRSAGFVPRELTRAFTQPAAFGHLVSVGVAPEAGKLGAIVAVAPELLSLGLTALPEALAGYSQPESALSPSQYERLQAKALAASPYRCALCGGRRGEEGWPVQPLPLWHVDARAAVLRLVGAHNVASALLAPAPSGERLPPGLSPAVGLETLGRVNRLELEDLRLYVAWLQRLAQERSRQGRWEVDLAWLDT